MVVDHYVKDSKKLVADVEYLYEKYDAPVVLGDHRRRPFPIFMDTLSETKQAQVVEDILDEVYRKKGLLL